jgi:hypothetical protein
MASWVHHGNATSDEDFDLKQKHFFAGQQQQPCQIGGGRDRFFAKPFRTKFVDKNPIRNSSSLKL